MRFASERLWRFFRLPPGERIVLIEGWGLFFFAAIFLRILPFKRLLTLTDNVFAKQHDETSLQPAPASVISRMAWLVEVAGRYAPVKVTCLKKALVLSWLLGRKGIATTLRIGVLREEGGLKAHAWLEREGRVIVDHAGAAEYEPLLPGT